MEFFTQNREVSLTHAESSLELTHRSELENSYSSSIHGTHDAEACRLCPAFMVHMMLKHVTCALTPIQTQWRASAQTVSTSVLNDGYRKLI